MTDPRKEWVEIPPHGWMLGGIYVNRILSAAEKDAVHRYLCEKYGIEWWRENHATTVETDDAEATAD